MPVTSRQRGSVLMLLPAGVLVVLLLGAIAFDMSLVFLRQRQASSVAADIANDVATLAVDEQHFRATGEFRLDPARAEAIGLELAATSDIAALLRDAQVIVVGDSAVEVRLTAEAAYVFARAIPGAADGAEVVATSTAQAASTPADG